MPHPPTPTPPPPPRPLQSLPKLTVLPDFLLTALSLFVPSTGPKHHHPPTTTSTTTPPRFHSLSYPPPTSRRFLRPTTTTMSQNPNFNCTHNFPTPQSLSDWLKPRLPSDSLSSWGIKPGTKNVHNLWLELTDGETSLADSTPPVRNLEVLSIRVIGKNNRVLIESHQELSDGSIRTRARPLSEKLKSDEDIESAVKRAVKEELGSILLCQQLNDTTAKDGDFDDEIVRILPNSYQKRVEERLSLSYPGLPACYVMHIVDARIEGLPEGEFVTEEGTEYGGDCDEGIVSKAVTVRKHFWKWVSADSV
ncbi:hypothetical protein Dimus_028127 [Dionaea muscipula]